MAAKNMPHRKQARRLAALKRFKPDKPTRKGVQTLEEKRAEYNRLTAIANNVRPL